MRTEAVTFDDPRTHRRIQSSHRLTRATIVYTCDEYRSDDYRERWVQVMFADRTHPCQGTLDGLDERRRGTCRSGWVRDETVEVLSG